MWYLRRREAQRRELDDEQRMFSAWKEPSQGEGGGAGAAATDGHDDELIKQGAPPLVPGLRSMGVK